MANSVFIITQHHKYGVHSWKYYCNSSHRLRQEEAEQTADREQTRSCTAQREPGEEDRPDQTGGDCPEGGHHGQGVFKWKKKCDEKKYMENNLWWEEKYDGKSLWLKLNNLNCDTTKKTRCEKNSKLKIWLNSKT